MQQLQPKAIRSKGFTLVELMIVASLLGLLAAAFGQMMVVTARLQARASMRADSQDTVSIARAIAAGSPAAPVVNGDQLVLNREVPQVRDCRLTVIDATQAPTWVKVQSTCGQGDLEVTTTGYVSWNPPAPAPAP